MCCGGSKLVNSCWQPLTNDEAQHAVWTTRTLVHQAPSVPCNSKAALRPCHCPEQKQNHMTGRVWHCRMTHVGEGAPQGLGGSLVWLNAG